MGKSLLTDDVIERAQRGETFDQDPYLDSDTKIITFEDSEENDYYDDNRIYKSRRIENARRSQFQAKLNLMLFALLVLIAILIFAVFRL
ncbi:cell wall synthase accessory phosphoprotein MacP [Streptococcus hongkongensis]|nr:membrane protein [Streptococcus uberis]